MSDKRKLACVMLGAVLFVGCEKSESTSSTPPAKPSADATESSAQSAASSAADSAQSAATNAKDMAHDNIDAAKNKLNAAGDSIVGNANSTGTAAPAVTTTAPANSAVSADTTEAQKLLDQAMQYIKENKLNDADTVLTKLEAMKPKLPAEWASKIDSARSAFNSAKAGSDKLKSLVPGGAK
jgi:hypothetical protein